MSGISGQVVRQIKDQAKSNVERLSNVEMELYRLGTWAQRFSSMGFWRRMRWLVTGK